MPDAIRITGGSLRAHPRRGAFRIAAAFAAAALGIAASPAPADSAAAAPPGSALEAYVAAFLQLDRHELAALALTLGILCFAVVTAILLVRTRQRLGDAEAAARDESIAARAAIDRAYALLMSEPQVLIAWAAASDEPEIIGDPGLVANAEAPHRLLAFGTWLPPEAARDMEHAVDALRARGISFAMTVTTLFDSVIEAEGHVIGGRAILRLREVSG